MPLAWFEGLQLMPQHFQAIDSRIDAMFARHLNMIYPYFWGVDELHIDEDTLSNGRLTIAKVSGCFPDGLVFEWTSAQDGALDADLSTEEEVARYCLAIAIEDLNEKGKSIRRYEKYISLSSDDIVSNDNVVPIIRWKPNLILKTYQRNDKKYIQIPLIDIIKNARGHEIGDFHPPSARLIVGSGCHSKVVHFARLLREKAELIKVSPVSVVNADDYHNSLGWIFNSVVGSLVNLESVLSDEAAHPQDIYDALCNIVASTSGLAGKIPPRLPVYSHLDIAERIGLVVEIAKRAIAPLGIDYLEWRMHSFLLNSGEWRVLIPDDFQGEEFLLQAVFDPVVSVSYVQTWLENVLIYVSGQKQNFREMRVRGLDRRLDTDPPIFDHPFNIDGVVFRVFTSGSVKVLNQSLVIENPDERLNLKIKSLSLMQSISFPSVSN